MATGLARGETTVKILRTTIGLTAMTMIPAALLAQVCRPGPESNEVKTFALLSVPLAYSGLGPSPAARNTLSLTIEGSYLPDIDPETSTPTVCRPGKGPENTNLISVLPRPRIGYSLPYGFYLEASWIPPITVNGAKSNLFGAAVAWSQVVKPDWTVTLRGHATFGEVEAPITCPDDALDDSTSECFGGTRSNDEYRPNIFGLDGLLSWSSSDGRWRPYLGAGWVHMAPRFQVNFTNAVGQVDSTRVEAELDRGSIFGGLQWLPVNWLRLGAEGYAHPADQITARVFGSLLLQL